MNTPIAEGDLLLFLAIGPERTATVLNRKVAEAVKEAGPTTSSFPIPSRGGISSWLGKLRGKPPVTAADPASLTKQMAADHAAHDAAVARMWGGTRPMPGVQASGGLIGETPGKGLPKWLGPAAATGTAVGGGLALNQALKGDNPTPNVPSMFASSPAAVEDVVPVSEGKPLQFPTVESPAPAPAPTPTVNDQTGGGASPEAEPTGASSGAGPDRMNQIGDWLKDNWGYVAGGAAGLGGLGYLYNQHRKKKRVPDEIDEDEVDYYPSKMASLYTRHVYSSKQAQRYDQSAIDGDFVLLEAGRRGLNLTNDELASILMQARENPLREQRSWALRHLYELYERGSGEGGALQNREALESAQQTAALEQQRLKSMENTPPPPKVEPTHSHGSLAYGAAGGLGALIGGIAGASQAPEKHRTTDALHHAAIGGGAGLGALGFTELFQPKGLTANLGTAALGGLVGGLGTRALVGGTPSKQEKKEASELLMLVTKKSADPIGWAKGLANDAADSINKNVIDPIAQRGANTFTDQVKQNTGLGGGIGDFLDKNRWARYAMWGAPIGAGLGLLTSMGGKKKNRNVMGSMLTGGLLGGLGGGLIGGMGDLWGGDNTAPKPPINTPAVQNAAAFNTQTNQTSMAPATGALLNPGAYPTGNQTAHKQLMGQVGTNVNSATGALEFAGRPDLAKILGDSSLNVMDAQKKYQAAVNAGKGIPEAANDVVNRESTLLAHNNNILSDPNVIPEHLRGGITGFARQGFLNANRYGGGTFGDQPIQGANDLYQKYVAGLSKDVDSGNLLGHSILPDATNPLTRGHGVGTLPQDVALGAGGAAIAGRVGTGLLNLGGTDSAARQLASLAKTPEQLAVNPQALARLTAIQNSLAGEAGTKLTVDQMRQALIDPKNTTYRASAEKALQSAVSDPGYAARVGLKELPTKFPKLPIAVEGPRTATNWLADKAKGMSRKITGGPAGLLPLAMGAAAARHHPVFGGPQQENMLEEITGTELGPVFRKSPDTLLQETLQNGSALNPQVLVDVLKARGVPPDQIAKYLERLATK